MLLLIDNYDSFVYNLAQYFKTLGQNVLVKRNDEITLTQIKTLRPHYIVLSPGPLVPEAAGVCIEVAKYLGEYAPILGVCLGHQSIIKAFGGQLSIKLPIMHGKVSPIYHDDSSLFKNMPTPFLAARYHSWSSEKTQLSDFLIPTAYTNDKQTGPVMATQHKTLPIFGVQFHPESILTECGHQLLENFLNAP